MWTRNTKIQISENCRLEKAANFRNKFCKKRALNGLHKYQISHISKVAKNEKLVQIYNKNLLKRILFYWTKIKLIREILYENYAEIKRKMPFFIKSIHFAIMKKYYRKLQYADILYRKLCKKRVLHGFILQHKKRIIHTEKILKIQNSILVRYKKLILIGLYKKTKRSIEIRQKLADFNKKWKFVKLLKLFNFIKRKLLLRSQRKLTLIKFHKKHNSDNKHKILSELIKYSKNKALRKEKLTKIKLQKFTKIFTKFKNQIKINKFIRNCFCEIKKNTDYKLILNNFIIWKKSYYKKLDLLKAAEISRNLVLKSKILQKWHHKIIKTKQISEMRDNLLKYYSRNLMRKTLNGFMKFLYDTDRINQKKAICFYLSKINQKYIRLLRKYKEHKIFIKNVSEYYNLRLKRRMLNIWTFSQYAKLKLAEYKLLSEMRKKRKILFILMIFAENKKQRKIYEMQASRYLVRNLLIKTMKSFKNYTRIFAEINKKINSKTSIKNKENSLKILNYWKNWSHESNFLNKILVKTYKNNKNKHRILDFIQNLANKINIKKKFNNFTKIHNINLQKNTLSELLKYTKNRKNKKLFLIKTCGFYNNNICRKILKFLKQKCKNSHIQKQKLLEKINKNTQKIKSSVLKNLFKYSQENRKNRIKLRNLSEIHHNFLLKKYFNKFKSEILLHKKFIEFKKFQKRCAFNKFLFCVKEMQKLNTTFLLKTQNSLTFYANSLFSKTIKSLQNYALQMKINKKYEHVKKLFILQKFFENWKKVYNLYGMSENSNLAKSFSSRKSRSIIKTKRSLNTELYEIME